MWNNNLLFYLTSIALSQEPDEFKWNLDQTGKFLVKSHYPGLIHQNTLNVNKRLWKLKAPLKIKIFLWVYPARRYPKWNWQGSQQCCCHEIETIQQLLFDYRMSQLAGP